MFKQAATFLVVGAVLLVLQGCAPSVYAVDPPEAYVSEEYDFESRSQARRVASYESSSRNEIASRLNPLAILAFTLGIISFPSVVVYPVSLALGLAAIVCASISLTQIHYCRPRYKGTWLSVVGIVLPAIAWGAIVMMLLMA